MTAQPTRYDRTMLNTMNREEPKGWHARRGQRRAWTVAHMALTVATPAAFPVARENSALLIALLVPLVLAWCLCTGVLNSSTRGLLELRARVLDERQLAERGRVHTVVHRTQTSLMAVGIGGLGVAHLLTDGDVDPWAPLAVLGALLLTHWLLPLWTAVLRTQDEPVPDDDSVEAAG